MRARRRFVAGLLAAMLVVVSVPGAAGGGAAAEPAAAPSEPAGEGPLRVTLVTGDRVDLRTVDGELVPRVEPAEGREGVRFSIHRAGDHLYVVPSDAIGLLGEGRLDRRLFDVATLVSFGYDDAHRSDLPLIVQAGPGGGRPAEAGEVAEAAAATEAAVAGTGGEVQALPAASATGVRQPKAHLPELWAELTRSGTRGASTGGGGAVRSLEAGIGTVWLDGLRQPSLDVSVPQIGAPAAWEAGYTGAGVTVAVLDSGIDATHPDLAGRIAGARNFTDEADPDDLVGHGTHVASTIAGSGAASGGRYRGVAPDARLLDGKVCDVFGCPESAVLAGMQWAADSGARVVNLSVGGEDTPGVDPLEAAIDALSAENGTLFVVAAGNDGPDEGTVASPASADAALAVGAVDDDDQLAEFSSRGPRVGDAVLKPEITAPGVGIVAARARNGFLGEPVGDRYVALDGTSMATPHVAGAAALVAQQHPGWTGAELEDLLVGSAATADGVDAFAQGAGRVDVGRAVAQDVYAEPAVVSAGRPAWPHGDDEPVTRTITYRNPGPEPVALALTVEGIGPDGEPAPPGVFTLGADYVSVPAGGGQASVEVTVDTSRPGPDGHLSGWVTATSGDNDAATDTAGDTVVTTPIAVDREAESYDLTVVNRDRNGAPASVYRAMVFGLDRNLSEFPSDPDGTFTVRLPRGRYLVDSLVQTRPEAERPDTAQLVQPLVDLDHDQTIELDARRALPLDIEIDSEHGDPRLQWALSAYSRLGELASVTSVLGIFDTLDGVTTGSFGPPVGRDEMVAQFQGAWAGEGERIYNLAWFDHGRMTTGLSRRVRDAQLARVTTDYQAIGEGRSGQHFTVPQAPGTRPFAWGAGDPAPLPGRRVELYTTRGVEWSGQVVQTLADPDDPDGLPIEEVWLDSRPRRYDAGRAYHERWNAAVLGPVVSDGTSTWCAELLDQTSERVGDRVTVSVAMLGDAAGHPGCGAAVGSTRLSLEGETVGETPSAGFGQFEVPADPGTYRIETDLTRHPQAVLSTRITAAWTFSSRHVAGEVPEPLPLMAVRFAPELDAHNRVPAGGRYEIPLSIDRLGDVGRIAQPHVEASFDDGRHWTPLRVTRRPDNRYVASLTHPHTAGFVSLRATATDNHGNTVEQTIIRAYELTSP